MKCDDATARRIIRDIRTKKSAFWEKLREKRSLELFHSAAKRVPAYKDFLKKNKVNPNRIKTFKDFELVPTTSKKDYLKKYPLEKLVWDGHLNKQLTFCSTSGSTGEPFYFPRGYQLDWEYSILTELYLNNGVLKKNNSILIIDGLSMGVWIAGLLSYQAFKIAAERANLPVSIITPGINKIEIFKALRNLSPNFNQTILLGYPPFLKDIIDEANDEKINLKKLNIRLLSGAEAYTEKFRDYLVNKANIRNACLDTLNVYGTADIGTMAYETPTSILLRRIAFKDTKIYKNIFCDNLKIPTVAQYNPHFVNFESPNNEILLTGNNVMPLIRYDVGDYGGIFSFDELKSKLMKFKIDLYKEGEKVHISESNIFELPFVYVYERRDFSTTLYGLQIYPEQIREVFLKKPISNFMTGKFTIVTNYDKNNNQYLEINIELKKNKKIKEKLKRKILERIVSGLQMKNSEFKELFKHLDNRALPKLVFWPAEHPLYFKPGVKQKWIKK